MQVVDKLWKIIQPILEILMDLLAELWENISITGVRTFTITDIISMIGFNA